MAAHFSPDGETTVGWVTLLLIAGGWAWSLHSHGIPFTVENLFRSYAIGVGLGALAALATQWLYRRFF